MKFPLWLLAGFLGAAVGGAAWVGIGYFTSYEVGWIAWGIGFLAGIGVRAAAGQDEGVPPGLAAVTAAIAVVAASKFLVVYLLVEKNMAEAEQLFDQMAVAEEEGPGIDWDDAEVPVSWLADEIYEAEYVANDKELEFPGGEVYETEEIADDYPPELWRTASERWEAMSDEEHAAKISAWEEGMDFDPEAMRRQFAELKVEIREEAFRESFGLFDLLWFGLAAFTAFKLGSGATGDE